ncbi:MAG: DMT family transporter [Alphaproteobacteria bacterium]|nr:DMT family transporter [Alphaproteobacteria bacterium]
MSRSQPQPAPQHASAKEAVLDTRVLAAFALAFYCAGVWGLHPVLSRLAVEGGVLGPADLAGLRFLVGGIAAAPVALGRRWRLGKIGGKRLLALALFAGPLYSLLFIGGLLFAPASHAGTITPGGVPVATTLLAWPLLRERPGPARAGALAVVVLGVALIGWEGIAAAAPGTWRGHLLFVVCAVMWAGFTVCLRRWRIDAVDAAVGVATLSCLVYVPPWLLLRWQHLGAASLGEVAFQGIYQGLLTGLISNIAYVSAIGVLGATRTAATVALVPVVATASAGPILGEAPGWVQLLGMAVVVSGMLAAVSASSVPAGSRPAPTAQQEPLP